MTVITQALWETEFPDIPMPDNIEYFDFAMLVKQKEGDQLVEDIAEYINRLKAILVDTSDDGKRDVINQMIETEMRGLA